MLSRSIVFRQHFRDFIYTLKFINETRILLLTPSYLLYFKLCKSYSILAHVRADAIPEKLVVLLSKKMFVVVMWYKEAYNRSYGRNFNLFNFLIPCQSQEWLSIAKRLYIFDSAYSASIPSFHISSLSPYRFLWT